MVFVILLVVGGVLGGAGWFIWEGLGSRSRDGNRWGIGSRGEAAWKAALLYGDCVEGIKKRPVPKGRPERSAMPKGLLFDGHGAKHHRGDDVQNDSDDDKDRPEFHVGLNSPFSCVNPSDDEATKGAENDGENPH